MSDMLLRLVISADGKASVAVVNENADSLKKLNEEQKRGQQTTNASKSAADQYVESLRKQVEQTRLSAAAMREMEARAKGASEAQIAQVRNLSAELDRAQNSSSSLAATFGRWIAPTAVLATVLAISSSLMEARLQVEKIQAVSTFANSGDVVAAGRDVAYVRALVKEFGLDLLVTSNSWLKFSAAARGSMLAGQGARDVFEAIVKASAALRMSGPETEGALLAVQQMMSKGNVQAEELRGQLGERLPGAFAIAARAMGVTERELNKLLETGQVLASDFLPKFGAQLTKELGDAPRNAAEGTQASINRMEAALVGVKQELSQVASASGGIKLVTQFFDNAGDAIKNARAESNGLLSSIWNIVKLTSNYSLAKFLTGDQTAGGRRNADALALGADMSGIAARIANPRAGIDNVRRLQEELDAKRALLAKMYQVDSLVVETEKDTLQRRAENGGIYAGLIDQRKQSDDRYLKELAAAGDKQAKLQLAYKDVDEKFAKDLAAGNRTLAEVQKLRAAEYKKIFGGDAKQAADAVYRSAIAQQEAGQKAIEEAVRRGTDALKAQRDRGELNEEQYYLELDKLRAAAIQKEEASVSAQLALARAGGTARLQDVIKFTAELTALDQKRVDTAKETEDRILKVQREAMAREVAARTKHNEVILGMVERLAELREQAALDLADKQFELELLGKSEQQQQRLQALRQVELAERRALTQAYKDYIKAINNADNTAQEVEITNEYNRQQVAIRANAAAQREVTAQIVDQSQKVTDQRQFWEGLFNSVKGGWKGVRDYIKNFFFDWLIKQLSQQFTMNIAVGGSGGAGGGIAGILGSLFGGGGAGGAGGGIGGILGSLFGGGGAGGIMGSILGQMPFVAGAGPLAAGTGLAGIAASLGFEGLAAGIAQFANFIPVIGPIIAIAATLLPMLLKNKDGLWFDINGKSPGGHPENQFTTALGSTIQLHGEGSIADLKPYVAQFQNLAQNFVDIFGKEVAERAAGVVNAYWTGYSERGRGTEYENAQEYAAALAKEGTDVLAEYFSRAFSVVNDKIATTISTWSGTTEDLVKYIQGVLAVQQSLTQQAPLLKAIIGETIDLDTIVALQKEGETLSDTFSRVLNTFTITNTIADMLGKGADAFGAVGMASLEARERLIALAGGIQQLSTDVAFYLDQFFTAEERAAMAVKLAQEQIASGFGALGLAVPATREQFRLMIKGIDLSTESGARLYAALLRLAPALDTVFDSVEAGAADGGPIFTINRAMGSMGQAAITAANAVNTAIGEIQAAVGAISFGDVAAAAAAAIQGSWANLVSIIESGGESMQVQLQRKLAAAQMIAASAQAAYLAGTRTPGISTAELENLRLQAAEAQRIFAMMASDMALFTTLTAQYGDRAADMFELEKWYRDQRGLAGDNAALLLIIEQSYQARRAQILASGTASGLSALSATIRAWLNNLLLNESLTTLTPQQRLDESRRQYEAALLSGDANAITSAANAYLQQARSFYASGSQYAAIFAAVLAQMQALANGQNVPVVPTPNVPTTGGRGIASSVAAVTQSRAAASAAERAATVATDALANIMAAVKYTIEDEGKANRQSRVEATKELIGAVSRPGAIRAAV